jgi:hypothetical protein
MIFECEKCGYTTNHKSTFIKHSNIKKSCIKKFKCSLCNRNLFTKNSIYKHLETCKEYNKKNNELNINSFYNEKIEHININIKIINNYLKNNNENIFLDLIKLIYFNEDIPENFIICLKKKISLNKCLFKDNNKWIIIKLKEVIPLILERIKKIIIFYIKDKENVNKIEELLNNNYNKIKINIIEKLFNNYKIMKERVDKNIEFVNIKKETYCISID